MGWDVSEVLRAVELPRKPPYSGEKPLFSSCVAPIPVLFPKRVS